MQSHEITKINLDCLAWSQQYMLILIDRIEADILGAKDSDKSMK